MRSILHNLKFILLLGLLTSGLLITSCDKDDDDGGDSIALLSFGPSPALRGGDLKFIGQNLDKVTAIVLPNNVNVTNFKTKTPELIVITVPEETVAGRVRLVTPQGDIESISLLTISEPIEITAISPLQVRPGDVITVTGDYLNLIKEIIFANKKSVTEFVSQSKEQIQVRVPLDAQTGVVTFSNGEADPILIEFETQLEVILPAVTQLSPNPVKAGMNLTIEGTDLDLVAEVLFAGGSRMSEFVSADSSKIVVAVPENAQDGPIKLVAASLVEVNSSSELILVVPTISSVSPNPAKTGNTVTVSGTDLDLITSVTFGGGKTGELQGGTATEITVTVPNDAIEGVVTFHTAANKSVSTATSLQLVKPAISSISPMETQTNQDITITGTNLDLVTKVIFTGDKEVAVTAASETELVVKVPPGTTSGSITLVAHNGDVVTSTQSLTILASNVPIITSMPTAARPGEMITIEGEKLDFIAEIIFPGNVTATRYGTKTATLLEVFVPTTVKKGFGTLTFVTTENLTVESPEINIQGVDPVVDQNLVFFDFNGTGSKDSWWGDTGGIENEAELTLDGTSYYRVNASLSGWSGFFWRNGGNNFPGTIIGTNIGDYVLKFDVNILEPITGGEFAWRLKGTEGDFWYYWKPWEQTGSYETNGWITVTIPLTAFLANGAQIQDLSTIDSDFGVAFNNGSSVVNATIDNVRFEQR